MRRMRELRANALAGCKAALPRCHAAMLSRPTAKAIRLNVPMPPLATANQAAPAQPSAAERMRVGGRETWLTRGCIMPG